MSINTPLRAWALACTITSTLICGLATPTLALANDVAATPSPKAKKKHVARPRVDAGSGETHAERDRRLTRECRGRPNAGACEGYAR